MVDIKDIGREGEQQVYNKLKKQGYSFFQADWVVEDDKSDTGYTMIEVKHQDVHLPSIRDTVPVLEHGIEKRQVTSRLKFERYTGIRCLIWIIDKEAGLHIAQYLDRLEYEGCGRDTAVNNKRLYPVEVFNGGSALISKLQEMFGDRFYENEA